MQIRVSKKNAPRLQKLAEEEFSSPTAIGNKAINEHLEKHKALHKKGPRLEGK